MDWHSISGEETPSLVEIEKCKYYDDDVAENHIVLYILIERTHTTNGIEKNVNGIERDRICVSKIVSSFSYSINVNQIKSLYSDKNKRKKNFHNFKCSTSKLDICFLNTFKRRFHIE